MAFLKKISKEHYFLFVILLASFITRIIYIFYFTDYKNYLVSDMGGYWGRAIGRYNGDFYSMWQWTSWATFFHFYLAFIFKILAFFKLFDYKLEVVIFLNIVYSVFSIFFFYLISVRIFGNFVFSLIATFCYAFMYPLIYLNSFILSENLSIPAIIFSLYLILAHNKSKSILFLAGLVLGVAVVSRPAIGLLGLSFFLYVFFANRINKYSFLRSISFVLGFFLVIFFVIHENSNISNGQLKTLAGNGGMTFFIAQCKSQWVYSYYNSVISIGSPTFLGNPGLARMNFSTDHPMHDQKYFYNLGFECMKRNPNIWIDNLILCIKPIFYGPLFPSMPSAKNFDLFIKISNYIISIMILSLGILFFLLKRSLNIYKELLLLISIPALTFLTMYFFMSEQRYLYPAYFAIYMLFFYIVFNIRKHKKITFIYFIIVMLIFLLNRLLN